MEPERQSRAIAKGERIAVRNVARGAVETCSNASPSGPSSYAPRILVVLIANLSYRRCRSSRISSGAVYVKESLSTPPDFNIFGQPCGCGCGTTRSNSFEGDWNTDTWTWWAPGHRPPKLKPVKPLNAVLVMPSPDMDTISQRKDWEAAHGKLRDYKSRFIPYSGWTCPACHVNLNNKPRPGCTSDRHMQYYAKRHPRYIVVSGQNSTS